MNKLQGFYELKRIGIPAVPWNFYTGIEALDPNLLWTIRMAVEYGDDVNLPRAVGVDAKVACSKAKEFSSRYKGNGLIIYYPYFIAIKSGIIEIKDSCVIIEAVKDDLWNLTTKGSRDITMITCRRTQETQYYGNQELLTHNEVDELLRYAARVRVKYKDYIFDRCSVLVEWSYAVNTDINRKPIGNKYIVFYECRTITNKY